MLLQPEKNVADSQAASTQDKPYWGTCPRCGRANQFLSVPTKEYGLIDVYCMEEMQPGVYGGISREEEQSKEVDQEGKVTPWTSMEHLINYYQERAMQAILAMNRALEQCEEGGSDWLILAMQWEGITDYYLDLTEQALNAI